jgi:hypothetical protein
VGGSQGGVAAPRVRVSRSKEKLGSDYHVREKVMPQKSIISYMHNVLYI